MIDLIFIVLGLLLYGLTNSKASEIGRLVFFAAMLAFLLHGVHVPTLRLS